MRNAYLFVLLLSLFGVAVEASAQVSFEPSKKYYIIENSTGRYVAYNVSKAEGSYGVEASGVKGDWFTFTASDGKWTIKNAQGKNFGAPSSGGWNTTEDATQWVITAVDGLDNVYTFKRPTEDKYLNYQTAHPDGIYTDRTAISETTYFKVVESTDEMWNKPAFGGTVWTWDAVEETFSNGTTTSTAPARESKTGPLYKYENVQVTHNLSQNTSDDGGIWVIGSTSNVTANLGYWAGSVLVETSATATVSYGYDLKGTEPDASATVWTDGALTFSGRTSFSMNDGSNQRWYIGENGAIWTSFTSVTRGTRTWDLEIVVADQPELANQTRTQRELRKKVMTWGADLSSNINSITVWYKDANGTYKKLGANAVSYDATGITVTYTGLGYAPVNCAYTLTDVNGAIYKGSYSVPWYGNATELPTLLGAEGYKLSNVRFSDSEGTCTMSADITFPFPVSSNDIKNPTGIQSELGTSKWFTAAESSTTYPCASKDVATVITDSRINMYNWNIYPSFSNGTFSFKIKNAAGGYIPKITGAQGYGTKNYLVTDESSIGSYYFVPCVGSGKGFSINTDGTAFLTINTSGRKEPVWVWEKPSGTDHRGSNLTFPTISANYTTETAQSKVEEYQALPLFDILKGSVVIGPGEFAAPATINDAIIAARKVTSTNGDAVITFLESQNAEYLKTYTSAVKTYGALVTTQFTMKAQYGTLILACPATRPSGLEFYGCSASEGAKLTLVKVDEKVNLVEKIPYIVEKTGTTDKYTIIGWKKVSDAEANTTYKTCTVGWLTGVLADDEYNDVDNRVYVPSGSYILSKYNNVLGFYQVEASNVKVCPKNKCYLTVTTPQTSPTRAFFFTGDGEVTGIEAIFGNTEKPVIYNTAGQRLNSLQKGVNIVNGHKVLVK